MWVFLNDAFLSIVADKNNPGMLLVRGRLPGDIERVFPDAKVKETLDHDYRFRTVLPQNEVSVTLISKVNDIDYPNFKGSVLDHFRHDVYMKVWGVMASAQRQIRLRF